MVGDSEGFEGGLEGRWERDRREVTRREVVRKDCKGLVAGCVISWVGLS